MYAYHLLKELSQGCSLLNYDSVSHFFRPAIADQLVDVSPEDASPLTAALHGRYDVNQLYRFRRGKSSVISGITDVWCRVCGK